MSNRINPSIYQTALSSSRQGMNGLQRRQASQWSLHKKRFNQSTQPEENYLGQHKAMLRRIFEHYTQYGDKGNFQNLRSHKYLKMMGECGIPADKVSLDILFAKHNRSRPNMTFDHFLNLLPRLAALAYPESGDLRLALERTIQEHFQPRYQDIMQSGIEGSFKEVVCSEIGVEEAGQLYEVLPVLLRIYKACFPNEFFKEDDFSRIEQLQKLSETDYYKFCSSFGLFPHFISHMIASSLWKEVLLQDIDTVHYQLAGEAPFQDFGFYFTFSRFLLFIISVNRIAMLRREGSNSSLQSIKDSLLVLFNHLQSSKGFRQDQERTSVSNSKNALVNSYSSQNIRQSIRQGSLPAHLLSQHSQSRREVDVAGLGNTMRGSTASVSSQLLSRAMSTGRLSFSNRMMNTYSKNQLLAESVPYLEGPAQLFETHTEELYRIFVAYASRGEPLNTTRMKSLMFNKMLRDAGVIKKKSNSISLAPRRSSASSGTSKKTKNKFGEHLKGSSHKARKMSVVDADFVFSRLTGSSFANSRTPSYYQRNSTSRGRLGRDFMLNDPSHLSLKSRVAHPSEGRLEFETFLKALEMIAVQLYPDLEAGEALRILLDNRILRLARTQVVREGAQGTHHIALLKEILGEEEVVNILSILHENIQVYFKYYSDSKGLLNYASFIRFYKDFGVFPRLASKAKLAKYFYALANLRESPHTNQTMKTIRKSTRRSTRSATGRGTLRSQERSKTSLATEQTDKDLLDSHLFVESIALISVEVLSQHCQNYSHSVIYGLQRLDNSEGSKIVQRALGSTRGAKGFNWSLLEGLEYYKQLLLGGVVNVGGLAGKEVSFDSLYQQVAGL